ncbi:citrate/2-methylcitrate synthase, partial [Pseudonocardia sp. SID8383]
MTSTDSIGAAAGQVPPGLRGVAVTSTRIGDVRGDEGFYHYSRYSAVDLARTRTFDDVWFLFVHGRLPDAGEAAEFAAATAERRALPDAVAAQLPAIADACGP